MIMVVLAAVITIAVPLCTLFETGSYLWCAIRLPEIHEEWVEIAVLSALSGIIFFGIRETKWKIAAAFLVSCVFCYVHVDLLPLLVTGLYFGGILLLGGFVRGTALVILCECALSLLKIGDAPHLRIAAGVLMIAGAFFSFRKPGRPDLQKFFSFSLSKEDCLMLAVVFVVFLVQAGRLNGTLDFDTLWYGVRSDHILAPSEGIYEDLGLLGMVYTYSKGFEVLELPLSGLRSYGYLSFFNVWIFLYGLYITYRLAVKLAGKRAGAPAVILSALVPGITNMSVSVKPDIITWVLQLMMLLEFFSLVKREKGSSVFRMTSAYLLSLAMKPTAVVFSTALFGMMFLFLLWESIREKSAEPFGRKASSGDMLTFLFSALALAGIWGRTVKLTGLPFTSVFSGLLSLFGFTVKYPFPEKALPQNYQDRSALAVLFDRVGHMLLSPTGKDMSHVLIAWGGGLIFFLLVCFLVFLLPCLRRERVRKASGEEEKNVTAAAVTVFVPFLITSLISLSMLYQVDGNYFITLYSIVILAFLMAAGKVGSRGLKKAVTASLVPILLFQFVLMTATNWASYVGFTPFRLNKGSYNHVAENREYVTDGRRAGETWDILSAEPEAKVIAFAPHPACLRLPAVTQSFEDTFDSWGNPEVVKTVDTYLTYFRFQGTDYVYADPDYFSGDTHQRAKKILDGLMEKGVLTEVTGDYCKLYRVELPAEN